VLDDEGADIFGTLAVGVVGENELEFSGRLSSRMPLRISAI